VSQSVTDCSTHIGVNVIETPTTVTVAAVSSRNDAADCEMPATVGIDGGYIELDYILNGRQLIHAALSAPWDAATNPIATKERPAPETVEEPTDNPPVLQDEVYVTSEGMGDIRIGQPVPANTKLATWIADACGGEPGQPWAGHWQASGAFDYDTVGHMVVDIVTTNGLKTGAVDHLFVASTEIPTKSGVRVGDSLESLQAKFPDLGDPVTTDGFQTYAIPGTAGKVLFDVQTDGPVGMGEIPEYKVQFILVIPISADPVLPIGDAYGSCKG